MEHGEIPEVVIRAAWLARKPGHQPEAEALRGKKVRIPRGVPIDSMGNPGWRVTKRSQVVTVDHVFNGHDEYEDYKGRKIFSSVACVCWAGSGGYWQAAPVEDVEVVE